MKEKTEKRIITEHPELHWWFTAITVKAHNQNVRWPRKIRKL
jgi:hypothetical protein